MSVQNNFLLLMVTNFISLKNVHSFSDHKQHPLRLKRNHDHEIKQQFYEINNLNEGQKHASSGFLPENTQVTTDRNLVGHNRIPRQIPSRELNTLHFHWDCVANRYRLLRESRFCDRAIDARGVRLRRIIPISVLTNAFLMTSLNVIAKISLLLI